MTLAKKNSFECIDKKIEELQNSRKKENVFNDSLAEIGDVIKETNEIKAKAREKIENSIDGMFKEMSLDMLSELKTMARIRAEEAIDNMALEMGVDLTPEAIAEMDRLRELSTNNFKEKYLKDKVEEYTQDDFGMGK